MKLRHVAALATTAVVAAGAGTALGQGDGGPPSGSLNFSVRLHFARQGFNPAVPGSKTRPKVADLVAFNADILVDGKKVGRSETFHVTTFEGGKKYRGFQLLSGLDVYDFGHGDVLWLSCLREDSPADNPCAVIGGTGRFAGARGSAVEPKKGTTQTRRAVTFPVRVTFVS
jgi:hypothetical protein